MKFGFDCTWFWQGGAEVGRWLRADAGKREELLAAGFVAVNGSSTIGAPEGPPSAEVLAAVLSANLPAGLKGAAS